MFLSPTWCFLAWHCAWHYAMDHAWQQPPLIIGRDGRVEMARPRSLPPRAERRSPLSSTRSAGTDRVPFKAPPPQRPKHLRPHRPEVLEADTYHDALVRFKWAVSGQPVIDTSGQALVIGCSFRHRWEFVMETSCVYTGMPLRVAWPEVFPRGHVLSLCAKARVLDVYVVASPPPPRA